MAIVAMAMISISTSAFCFLPSLSPQNHIARSVIDGRREKHDRAISLEHLEVGLEAA